MEPADDVGSTRIFFRPHMFGSFDLHRCPLQLRRAMETPSLCPNKKQKTSSPTPTTPPSTVASRTTQRGIDFERDVISCLGLACGGDDDDDDRSGQVIDFLKEKKEVSAGDANGNADNCVLFNIIERAVQRSLNNGGGVMFIDQLELQPPQDLLAQAFPELSRHYTSDHHPQQELEPLGFKVMKPDVVAVHVDSKEEGTAAVVTLTIGDIKSSGKMKRSHQMQVGFYAVVLENVLAPFVARWNVEEQKAAKKKKPCFLDVRISTVGQIWRPVDLCGCIQRQRAKKPQIPLEAASIPKIAFLHDRHDGGDGMDSPLAMSPSMIIDTFDVKAAMADVSSFFEHFMPLALRRPSSKKQDIEDFVPWSYGSSTTQHCGSCNYRFDCSAKATALGDVSMMLGLPSHASPSSGTSSSPPILEGVPRNAPVKTSSTQTPLSRFLTKAIGSPASSVFEHIAKKKALAVETGTMQPFHFKNELSSTRTATHGDAITDFAFFPSPDSCRMVYHDKEGTSDSPEPPLHLKNVASVILACEPQLPSAFIVGSVSIEESSSAAASSTVTTTSVQKFIQTLARPEVEGVVVWNVAQRQQLREVLAAQASAVGCDAEDQSTTIQSTTVELRKAARDVFFKLFPCTDSTLLVNKHNVAPTNNKALYAHPQVVFVAETLISSNVALPIPQTNPSATFGQMVLHLLARDRNGHAARLVGHELPQQLGGAERDSSNILLREDLLHATNVEDLLLTSTAENDAQSAAQPLSETITPLLKHLLRTVWEFVPVRKLKPPPPQSSASTAKTASSPTWSEQLQTFHTATVQQDCFTAQAKRCGIDFYHQDDLASVSIGENKEAATLASSSFSSTNFIQRLVPCPQRDFPSLPRYKVDLVHTNPFLAMQDEWLETRCGGKALEAVKASRLRSLHATIAGGGAGQQPLSEHFMREATKTTTGATRTDFQFELVDDRASKERMRKKYCPTAADDASKKMSEKITYMSDGGTWYFRPTPSSSSSGFGSLFKPMEDFPPLKAELEFSSGNLLLVGDKQPSRSSGDGAVEAYDAFNDMVCVGFGGPLWFKADKKHHLAGGKIGVSSIVGTTLEDGGGGIGVDPGHTLGQCMGGGGGSSAGAAASNSINLYIYVQHQKGLNKAEHDNGPLLCAIRSSDFNSTRIDDVLSSLHRKEEQQVLGHSSTTERGNVDPLLPHVTGDFEVIEARRRALRPLTVASRSSNDNDDETGVDAIIHPDRARVFSDDQRRFFTNVAENPLSVLWGPPGTGKTFTLAHLLFMLLSQKNTNKNGGGGGFSILCVAFTHKAIEVLREALLQHAPSCEVESPPIDPVTSETDKNDERTLIVRKGSNVVVFCTVWKARKTFSGGPPPKRGGKASSPSVASGIGTPVAAQAASIDVPFAAPGKCQAVLTNGKKRCGRDVPCTWWKSHEAKHNAEEKTRVQQAPQAAPTAAAPLVAAAGVAQDEPLPQLFDVLVVDEASQMAVTTALVASSCVKPDSGRIVLAGDPLQLSPILSSAAQNSRVAQEDPELRAVLLGSVLEAVLFTSAPPAGSPKRDGTSRHAPQRRWTRDDLLNIHDNPELLPAYVTQLTTTYRSDLRPLVDFVGTIYPRYHLDAKREIDILNAPQKALRRVLPSGLFDAKKTESFKPLQLHLLLSGDPEAGFTIHQGELRVGAEALHRLLFPPSSVNNADAHKEGETWKPPTSIGIVTPHRRQREDFKRLVKDMEAKLKKTSPSPSTATTPPKIVIDTAERMQGQEFEIVIIALASVKQSFTYNLNRLNVAFSRAQRGLIVISTEAVLHPAEHVKRDLAKLRAFGPSAGSSSSDQTSLQLVTVSKDVEAACHYLQRYEAAAQIHRTVL